MALTALTHRFLPQLIDNRGVIINVASHAAFQPVPYMAAYAATKAYVLHFSESLHTDLEDTHPGAVRAMALCPGATSTLFWERSNSKVENTCFTVMTAEKVVDYALKALDKRNRCRCNSWSRAQRLDADAAC